MHHGNGLDVICRLRFHSQLSARFLFHHDLPRKYPFKGVETDWFPVWFPFVSSFPAKGAAVETSFMPAR